MIDRARITEVRDLIDPYVRRTPVLTVAGADLGLAVDEVHLKLELLQRSGSFKVRGAFTNLLVREIPDIGVVAASGGNHGAAVAFAAMTLRVPAKIFVPSVSSPAKVRRIREYGADLVVGGDRYADALEASERFIGDHGAVPIHAFDDVETLLGTGTVALELEGQVSNLDTVLVAVGGGGLIGGIAAWCAGRVRVVAVEPDGAPTLAEALRAGRPVDAVAGSVAADSLAPRRVGDLMFPIAQRHVDRVVLVTDDEIGRAQRRLWEASRLLVEPGGATAFAALLSGRYEPQPGERVAVVLSGGNTDPASVAR